MTPIDPQRVAALRAVVDEFLRSRLAARLDKLKADDEEARAARARAVEQFERSTWLADATRRARQIQLVTHVLKATHPDLGITRATSLYVVPASLASSPVVGSHVLGERFTDDATGNAAALDIYDFLTRTHDGRTLLDLVRSADGDLMAALSDHPDEARAWMAAFAQIVESPCAVPTSHALAKQVYWPVGDDPQDDGGYHLLAPMHASSLAHRVYQTIQVDRFGDEAKAARQARRDGVFDARAVREYPHLAVQKLGGTKPQNISQLNSERRGDNCLLASLPPVWVTAPVRPLLDVESMFTRFGTRDGVRRLLQALRAFLASDPRPTVETRQHRADLLESLLDELLQFTAEVRLLEPGWSLDPACRLPSAERQWLDPGARHVAPDAAAATPVDAAEQVAGAFANWLNARLRSSLPMGDPEYLEWRKRLLEHLQYDALEAGDDA